jgi:hypothetical protein
MTTSQDLYAGYTPTPKDLAEKEGPLVHTKATQSQLAALKAAFAAKRL